MSYSRPDRKCFSIFLIFLMLFTLIIPHQAGAQNPLIPDLSVKDELKLEIKKENEQKLKESPQVDNRNSKIPSLLDGIDSSSESKDTEDDVVMDGKVEATLNTMLESHETVDVIIRLQESVDMQKLSTTLSSYSRGDKAEEVVDRLKTVAKSTQVELIKQLKSLEKSKKVSNVQQFWVFNGVSATVSKEALKQIAKRKDVKEITLDIEIQAPEFEAEETKPRLPEWGIEKIFASKVWGEYGLQGKNIVVGIMDTGVQGDHEALRHNYRGRDGDHASSWIDVSANKYSTPRDGHGHGTHVTGSAVGGGAGEPIGVAPDAEWIAAKIFDDNGKATASGIHNAFQWFLAPGGDPSKAPHVVNNSWGHADPYRMEFSEGVEAWVAAGIFPLFAAGNEGPGPQTVNSPASYPKAFSIGATDIHDQVASFSSRGPVYWPDENGESMRYIKPEVSAPGHSIYSALPNGGYGLKNGTSMATPHVAGAIALLLQSQPDLSIDEVANLLKRTARTEDHMGMLPNDSYGNGVVNVYQAVTEASFAGEIEGELKDQDGNPISGELYFPKEKLRIDVKKDGLYKFKIREGTHEVEVKSFGYHSITEVVVVKKGEGLKKSFSLEQSEVFNVAGTVTDENGNPVPYAYIRVSDMPISTVRTNAIGQFDLASIPVNDYTVIISGKGIKQKTEVIKINKDMTINFIVESININAQDGWSTSKNNFARNAITSAEIDAEKLTSSWYYQTPGELLFSSPVVAEGKVVFTTDRGFVIAIDQDSGKELWSVETGSMNRSTPTIVDGAVYVAGGGDLQIHAIDLNTGMKKWSKGLDYPAIYESPIYHDGILYISSYAKDEAKVIALNANTGGEIWAKKVGNIAYFGASLGMDSLFVGTYGSKTLAALSLDKGEEQWKVTVEKEGFAATPVYEDGVVYAVTSNFDNGSGTLRAFNATNGKELWSVPKIGNTEAGTPIIYDNLVVIGSATTPLMKAFNKTNGELVWEVDNGSPMVNSGAVSGNGNLYVTDLSSKLKIYDVYSGELLRTFNLNNASTAGVALTDGQVIVADVNGVFSFESPGILSGKITDANGDPVVAKVSIAETGEFAETKKNGDYTLNIRPGTYDVKIVSYGHKQITEEITFVSGYSETKDYQLESAKLGSISGEVIDKRSGNPLEDVAISVNDTSLESKTNSLGEFTLPEVYEGTYDLLFSLAGFVDTIVPVKVVAGEKTVFDFELSPVDVAVLDDLNGEVTRFLNSNDIHAEERNWDVIEEIGSYQILYLNGAYTSSGKRPTEEKFEALIKAAEENDVSVVFTDTWGPSYGSLRQLWEFRNDPAEYGSNYVDTTSRLRVDVEHPIFEGLKKGMGYTTIENGHLAWFNQYSGRHLATVGTTKDGYRGTGVAYKGISENSGHLLLSSHAASPWSSPSNGWTYTQQQILKNGVNFFLDVEFGKALGSIKDTDGNPIEATVEVVETGVTVQSSRDGTYEMFHDEGSYKLLFRKSGYLTKEVTIEFEHGQSVIKDVVMETAENGAVSGKVTNKVTGQDISEAKMNLYDSDKKVIKEVVSKVNGSYEITDLIEGEYSLEVIVDGFVKHTETLQIKSAAVTLNIELYPTPNVGIIGDGSSRNLRGILSEVGIEATNYNSVNNILPDIKELDSIFFITQSTGSVTQPVLASLMAEADEHGVSVIFGDDYYSGSGINHLVNRLQDPKSRTQHNNTKNSAGYVVIEENPIFGKGEIGEYIDLLVPARSNIASFDEYSGYPLAYIKHDGNEDVHGLGVAYKPRTATSMELLMSGHAVGILRNADEYTQQGQDMFVNAILWASYIEFNEVAGKVTDEKGEPLHAYVELPSESIGTWTDPETGSFNFGSIDGDFDLVTNSFAYQTYSDSITVDENLGSLNIVMTLQDEIGSIEGTLIDENTLEGINGAHIEVVDQTREGKTNISGDFKIDHLEPGTYTLIVTKDGYVLQELSVKVKAKESTIIKRKMKPTPLIGVIVDSQSTSALSLKNYLTPRGYEVEEIIYTDLERVKDFDLIFANSDFNNSLNPNKKDFVNLLKEIDKTETSVIWTGAYAPKGSIRFLREYTGSPAMEKSGTLPAGQRELTATSIKDHPILEGVKLDENKEFTFPNPSYYGFEGYNGTTIAEVSHENHGELGSLIAYGGRTLNSVEVLLSTMVFGSGFGETIYFDKKRERIINNAITWALDNEEAFVGEIRGKIENEGGRGTYSTIVIEETGYTFDTEADGSFFLALDSGTYTMTVNSFGHQSESFQLEIERGEKADETFVISSEDAGLIKGQIKAEDTSKGIEGATIQLLGTPLKTTTDAQGYYEIQAPTDEYQIRVTANGYSPQTLSAKVEHNKEVTVNMTLTITEKIAFVGTTINGNRVLPFLEEQGYDVDFWLNSTIDNLMAELDEYSLVILNDRHSSSMPEAKFKAFIDLADSYGVSIIFNSQYNNGSIIDLNNFYDDPGSQRSAYAPTAIDYEVLKEHPIFRGYDVGDKVTILQHDKAGSNVQYNAFGSYSGTTIANLTHEDQGSLGGGLAYDFRTSSNVHVLLGGLNIGTYGHPADRWTEDAKNIFTNAIDWSLSASLGEINGTVKGPAGKAITSATLSIKSQGLTTKTNDEGGYRLGVGIGEHEVRIQARGYISQTKMVEIGKLGDVVELNFEMEKTNRMTVFGKVTDLDGTGLENAKLTLREKDGNDEKVEVTNNEGSYQFEELIAGEYELTLEANGYQTIQQKVIVEDEDNELNFKLSEFNIAVIGDVNNTLEEFFEKNRFPAQSRDWDIIDDVYNYEVIIINSNKGTNKQVEKLIAESDKYETSLLFVDTWGPEGSIQLLERLYGKPTRANHGYNEGAVFIDVQKSHDIFSGLEERFEVQSEKSPYATFENYDGITLGNIVVNDEDKGAAVAYDFRGKNHMHLLLSSYAVNNMIGPDKGWTSKGKQLFLQTVEWARDGVQELPEIPKWTDNDDIITNGDFELSGTADYRSTVSILHKDDVLATVSPDRNNTFNTTISDLAHGQYELTLQASNFAGEVTSEELIQVIVDRKSPEVEVTTPTNNFVTGKEVVDVSGTVVDENFDRLLVNDEEVIVKDGQFTTRLILEEGSHTITVSAYDLVGNETTVERQVTVILTSLVLTELKPSTNQEVVPGDEIEISFRSDTEGGDANFVVQLPNQKAVQSSGGNQMEEVEPGFYKGTWIVPNMEVENAIIKVELTDAAGNSANEEAQGRITVLPKEIEEPEVPDAPVIENIQPATDQYVVPGDEVEISFSSKSERGTAGFIIKLPVLNSTQTVNNEMVEVDPGVYKGTWTVPANTNLEGAVIQVELTDAAGNKVTKEAEGKLYISQDQLERISGDDRYLTAIETSKKGWAKSDTVVIARGDDFADALAGVPLAYQKEAPVLLTLNKKLYKETLTEIKRLGAKKVIILGGSSAISDSVAKELEKAGLKVERIAGENRFDTAARIASEVAPAGAGKVVVANGMDFPDALSVAAHAAKAGLPILLTQTNKVPKETKDAIGKLKASQTIVVGGTSVVSAKVAKELPKATRLAGADRYETNVTVAEHFGVESKHAYVATGKTYADALTGSVLAAKNNSTILLVHDKVPEVVTTYITESDIKHLTIFGGEAAVSSKVLSDLKKIIQ